MWATVHRRLLRIPRYIPLAQHLLRYFAEKQTCLALLLYYMTNSQGRTGYNMRPYTRVA